MALGPTVIPYDVKSEEAGDGHYFARFTIGASGAVPATTFRDGAGWTRVAACLTAISRLSAGKYKFVFDGFFVPGYSAANAGNQMGSNVGASPLLNCLAQIIGNHGTPGTDATGFGRVIVDNTNNQDASNVCFITVEFDVGATATDPASADEVNVEFALKTDRP